MKVYLIFLYLLFPLCLQAEEDEKPLSIDEQYEQFLTGGTYSHVRSIPHKYISRSTSARSTKKVRRAKKSYRVHPYAKYRTTYAGGFDRPEFASFSNNKDRDGKMFSDGKFASIDNSERNANKRSSFGDKSFATFRKSLGRRARSFTNSGFASIDSSTGIRKRSSFKDDSFARIRKSRTIDKRVSFGDSKFATIDNNQGNRRSSFDDGEFATISNHKRRR